MKPVDLSKYPNMADGHRILVREYEYILSITDDSFQRGYYTTLLQFLLDGCEEGEAKLSAARMHGLRLPDFRGDEMGRPADDYDSDDWSNGL